MAAPYTDANGVYHADPDAEEFGAGSLTYNALKDLTKSHELAKKDSEKASIAQLGTKVREIARKVGNDKMVFNSLVPKSLLDYELNNVEKVLYIGDNISGAIALKTGKEAADLTNAKFGTSWGIANNVDAFRHGCWSMLLTIEAGANFSTMWTNAHEFGNPDNMANDVTDRGTTRHDETVMDLFNNSVGIHQGRSRLFPTTQVPRAYVISRIISDRLAVGGLKILVN